MSLYRRKDSPNWWLSFRMKGNKRVYKSTGTSNKKLAERIHAGQLTAIAEGRWFKLATAIPANTMFKDLAEQYLEWAKRQRAFKTKKGHVEQATKFFSGCNVESITVKNVEQFRTMLLDAGSAPATANRYLDSLKHMLTKAVEWDLAGEDLLKRIRRVKHLPINNRRLRFLSRENAEALVSASSPHLKPIVICALNTGMRREEILSLEWDRHVDLRHGFILLAVTKNGERREVPINATLRRTLQGLVRRINSPYVFTDEKGKRFRDVKRSFQSALRRTGIKDFRFHDLRHTFASQLIMAGVDITTVQKLLGHKTLTMTLRYAHLAQSHLTNAVKVLDNGYDLVTLRQAEKGVASQTP